jgi:hypothetical protein
MGSERGSEVGDSICSPISVSVVVDSRNVHGMIADVLGVGATPSVSGITKALARYGMKVVDIAVATATQTVGKNAPAAISDTLKINAAYAGRIRAEGGRVLEGILQASEGGRPREKQVDVLCAVELIRMANRIQAEALDASAVILLSGDKDIEPAVLFARDELGIPIYTAAQSMVDNRGGDWLLLDELALQNIAGSHAAPRGSLRRSLITAALMNSADSQEWVVAKINSDEILLRSRAGLEGVLPLDCALDAKVNDSLNCWVKGATFNRTFPQLLLATQPCSRPATLIDAQVLRRGRATKATVGYAGKEKFLTTPVGNPWVGDSVLLHVEPSQGEHRLIGTVSRDQTPPGNDAIRIVRVLSLTPKGDAVVEGATLNRGILKLPKEHKMAIPGDRYAAISVIRLDSGMELLHPVSTKLPRAIWSEGSL